MKRKHESVFIYLRRENKRTFTALMLKSILKKLDEGLLQKFRIDIQHHVARLNIPDDLVALLWKLAADSFAQILDKISRPVRNEIDFYIAQFPLLLLHSRDQSRTHIAHDTYLA